MKTKTLGIVGGGQLGRMLTQAAKTLGLKTVVLDPTPASPAGQIADKQIVGDFKDPKQIKKLSKYADFITFEIEGANAQTLKELKELGTHVQPSPETLEIIQDKLLQKQMLKKAKVPTADFASVANVEDIKTAIEVFNFPIMLKARFHGYDGRGNALVRTKAGIKQALRKLGSANLYAERYVDFKKELAVQVAKGRKGEIKTYPVVETIQKNNICHIVLAPAKISKASVRKALSLAVKVAKNLKGSGVFGIEMFMTKGGKIIVNEIAPRVHNSGHYTIEACKTSQFEQHVRAVCQIPLGATKMIVPAAVMVNILGTRNGPANLQGLEKAQKLDRVFVHVYGKKETRVDRKMGHVTSLDTSLEKAFKKAQAARRMISI
jgi:5-(carboxyamino)imidazole ribonucleotide synthase